MKLRHFCGGALVASKHVISAAHCMFEYEETNGVTIAKKAYTANDIKIRIGDHDLNIIGEVALFEKSVNVVI